jgi:hypothetical protein
MAKAQLLTIDDAKTLALQGLTFLASDAERLSRFLTLTGIAPSELRGWDANPGLQGAVLEHLLADESLLLVFAAEIDAPPERIAPAYQLLYGAEAGDFD